VTPRQKVFKRCRLKVYFQRYYATGYTAIGQVRSITPFQTDSTGRKLKWLLKKVSAFATYDLDFYAIEWLSNENIPS